MTEQPQEQVGIDEEQDQVYAPAAYPDPDPDSLGRWAIVGDGDGLVWTDDTESAGVTWVHQTDQVAGLWKHFQIAKMAGVPAGVAYQLAVNQGGLGEEQYGKLDGLTAAFQELMKPAG